MVNLRIPAIDAGSRDRSTLTSSNRYHLHSTSSLRSMMTLAMTLMFFVISSQNMRCGRNVEQQRRKGRHHFRRFDCSVWPAVSKGGGGEEEMREPKRDLSNVNHVGCGKSSRIAWTKIRRTHLKRSEMKSLGLGKDRRRTRRAPARSLVWGLFIRQCRVVYYS
jgi:hypothetical protein